MVWKRYNSARDRVSPLAVQDDRAISRGRLIRCLGFATLILL